MKEYKYKESKRKINGIKHDVIIPEKHSTIQALILETKDLNAWDDYANITRWHTLCMVLKKDEKEWETIYDGSTRGFNINDKSLGGSGIFPALLQLEKKFIREREYKKEEIKEIKDRMKKDVKRLKELGAK